MDSTEISHQRPGWRVLVLFCWAVFCWAVVYLSPAGGVQAQETRQRGPVYQVEIEGIVTVMTVGYIERALDRAEDNEAMALIIRLGNGGAVLRDLRPLAVQLVQATVPVVVYVAPPGTESGAAGTFLLSASHIAAMAPDTSFGISEPLTEVDQVLSEQTQDLLLDSATQQLREWNTRRGRNGDWVGRAVREGHIFTNEQAFATAPPSINMVAQDTTELLTLLQGRTVTLENGQQVTLETLGKEPRPIHPSLWEQFLFFLTNPTTMFLLLVMGLVALYAEFAQPGVGIFSGLGLVLLIGALVGLIVLPIRWISLAGFVLAFAMIAVDLFVPTHGGLTLTGLVFLVISAFTLIDTAQAPGVFIALWAILLVGLTVAAFAAIVIWLIVRLRSQPVTTGEEGLVGKLAEVRGRLAPEGVVFVEGALWRAICENGEAEKGEWVRVVAVHSLRLVVHRLNVSGAQPLDTNEDE